MFSVVVFESVLIYVKMPRQHHFLHVAEGENIKYPFTLPLFSGENGARTGKWHLGVVYIRDIRCANFMLTTNLFLF